MPIHCEICRSSVHSNDAAGQVHLEGTTRYFCCEACRRTFREHPDLFPLHSLEEGMVLPARAVSSA